MRDPRTLHLTLEGLAPRNSKAGVRRSPGMENPEVVRELSNSLLAPLPEGELDLVGGRLGAAHSQGSFKASMPVRPLGMDSSGRAPALMGEPYGVPLF